MPVKRSLEPGCDRTYSIVHRPIQVRATKKKNTQQKTEPARQYNRKLSERERFNNKQTVLMEQNITINAFSDAYWLFFGYSNRTGGAAPMARST